MMHMDDAVGAALQILSAPRASLRCTEAYNINAMSFNPQELFAEIRRHVPGFEAEIYERVHGHWKLKSKQMRKPFASKIFHLISGTIRSGRGQHYLQALGLYRQQMPQND